MLSDTFDRIEDFSVLVPRGIRVEAVVVEQPSTGDECKVLVVHCTGCALTSSQSKSPHVGCVCCNWLVWYWQDKSPCFRSELLIGMTKDSGCIWLPLLALDGACLPCAVATAFCRVQ